MQLSNSDESNSDAVIEKWRNISFRIVMQLSRIVVQLSNSDE